MKTAAEKAKEFIVRWNVRGEASYELELLLKEQDRDTRHACAEAVMGVESKNLPTDALWKDDAHDACMNVKAV